MAYYYSLGYIMQQYMHCQHSSVPFVDFPAHYPTLPSFTCLNIIIMVCFAVGNNGRHALVVFWLLPKVADWLPTTPW
jgi:hypothetical protein